MPGVPVMIPKEEAKASGLLRLSAVKLPSDVHDVSKIVLTCPGMPEICWSTDGTSPGQAIGSQAYEEDVIYRMCEENPGNDLHLDVELYPGPGKKIPQDPNAKHLQVVGAESASVIVNWHPAGSPNQ